MVFFNYSTMQMAAKVVYYGPGLCGKTTNLQWIFEHTSTESRGEMVSLATETDRTLFFDLLPIDVGSIAGFSTRIQLYTVPGQVFYNTTRKLVLKGVDGVVFVADSQRPMLQANVESFQNLEENLAEMGLSVDNIPVVLQYNKRDLPGICSPAELDEALNRHDWPSIEASALNGDGVFETLKMVSKATLLALKKRLTKTRPEGARVPGGKRPVARPPGPPRSAPAKKPTPPPQPAAAPAPPTRMRSTEDSGRVKRSASQESPSASRAAEASVDLDLEPPALEVAAPKPEAPKPEAPKPEASRPLAAVHSEAPAAAAKSTAPPAGSSAAETPERQAAEQGTPGKIAAEDTGKIRAEARAEAEDKSAQEEARAAAERATARLAEEARAAEERAAQAAAEEARAAERRAAERANQERAAATAAAKAAATPSRERPKTRKRARSVGFDALEELEKLRRQAVTSKGAPERNGKHEINRDFRMKLTRSAFSRAQRVALTLQVEDAERQAVDEAHQLYIDIEDASSIEEFLLRLNIALDATA